MEIYIPVIAAVLIIAAISVFFLMQPRKNRAFSRKRDEDSFDVDVDQIDRPKERPAPRPQPLEIKNPYGGTSTMAYIVGGFRAVIGLAAVLVLVYTFNSTRDTLQHYAEADLSAVQVIQVYVEGMFQAVITIGIAIALYIVTRFTHH